MEVLQNGLSLIMEPVVDFHLKNSRSMQTHSIFTLPEIDHDEAICTVEQLVPISYQLHGHCFGGQLTWHDLLLLSPADKWYVIKHVDLEQCYNTESIILCPTNVLSTFENQNWLGMKWTLTLKVLFKHSHVSLPNC